MPATFYLFACALAVAQPAPANSAEWQLQPRLARGLELVYRGSFVEQDDGPGVGFRKTLHLENRVFVLDVGAKGTEAAFFTLWKGPPAPGEKTPATAVRLERAHIDGDGAVRPPTGGNLTAALDGPPTAEVGMFVTVPGAWAGIDRSWEVAESGRPPRHWRVAGAESVGGIRCVHLVGVQHSADWERPSSTDTAWERTDTVWLDPQTGYARKLERTVARREPGRNAPGQRFVLKYELESAMTYPNHLAEDRQREIQETMTFNASVVGLLPRAGQVGARPFEAVLAKIHYHVDHDPPTPYREALLQVQRLAEAGRRGESPPELPTADPTPLTEAAVVGKHAPDFLAAPIGEGAGVQLRTFVGRPVLLVFYNPTDSSADEVLRFAQRIRDVRREKVTVLSLAVSEDAKRIQQQRDDLRLSLPVLSGTGLTLSYGVEATPKILVLDGLGVVHGSYVGWGPEIPHSVQGDLDHCRTVPK